MRPPTVFWPCLCQSRAPWPCFFSIISESSLCCTTRWRIRFHFLRSMYVSSLVADDYVYVGIAHVTDVGSIMEEIVVAAPFVFRITHLAGKHTVKGGVDERVTFLRMALSRGEKHYCAFRPACQGQDQLLPREAVRHSRWQHHQCWHEHLRCLMCCSSQFGQMPVYSTHLFRAPCRDSRKYLVANIVLSSGTLDRCMTHFGHSSARSSARRS